MTPEELAEANQLIAHPPEFNLSAVRLGLFVVSRLAERHGMRVQLRESPYGGTTAIVLIPRELISELTPEPVPEPVPAVVGAVELPAQRVSKRPPRVETDPAPAARTAPTDQPAALRQTSTGLPVRNRQANLPDPVPEEAAPPPGAGDRPRPPERVRSMIASYQAGTRRARAEMPAPSAEPPLGPPGTDDQPTEHNERR
jgi:hypothetical protein